MVYMQCPHELEIKFPTWMGLEPWHSGLWVLLISWKFKIMIHNWSVSSYPIDLYSLWLKIASQRLKTNWLKDCWAETGFYLKI